MSISCTPEEMLVLVCSLAVIILSPHIAAAIAAEQSRRVVRKAFGVQTLADLIRAKRVTKRAVARRLKVPVKDVRDWCNGTARPDVHQAEELASILGVSEREVVLAIDRRLH